MSKELLLFYNNFDVILAFTRFFVPLRISQSRDLDLVSRLTNASATRSTEDALKRMAKRVKQLEAEAADLQASWDAERRDLLRRELLTSQLCDLMVPQLRPGCPFRDIAAVRAAATWCDELGRWRLPDVSPHIPLPPAAPVLHPAGISPSKADLNNNSNNGNGSNDDDEIVEENDIDENASKSGGRENRKFDIADIYFRRKRVDTLLAHAREVKNKNFGKSKFRISLYLAIFVAQWTTSNIDTTSMLQFPTRRYNCES